MKQLSDDIVLIEGSNELNVQMTPIAAVVSITGATWELIDYPFEGYWPEETGPLYAIFCKGRLQVDSASEFVGSVEITCPNTIAPVPLLTAYGYQAVLDEIDTKIAESIPGGATERLWIARRAIFLSYPKINGFTIDYRWWASADPDDQNSRFRDLINASPVDIFTLDNVLIPAGASIVEVGFFASYGAAVGLHPATVSLYSNGILLDSIESDLVPPTDVPQLLGLTIPTSVASGGEINSTLVLRLPPQASWDYSFTLSLDNRYGDCELARAKYARPSLVNTQIARGCTPMYLPLDAPDNIYTVQGLGKAEYYTWRPTWAGGGYYTPLPPGVYPIELSGESWRISLPPAPSCGVYLWGLTPAAKYDFGVVGYIEVV